MKIKKKNHITENVGKKRYLIFLSYTFFLFILFFWCILERVYAQTDSLPLDSAISTSEANGSAMLGLNVDDPGPQVWSPASPKSTGVWAEQLGESVLEDHYSVRSDSNTEHDESTIIDNNRNLELEPDLEQEKETSKESSSQNWLVSGPQTWFGPESGWFGREGVSASLKTLLVMSAFSLAPAILLMTTSYIRVSVVLSLLRQALGAGQIPSNQVVAALSIFLTILIMSPVWTEVYNESITPYSNGEITNLEALDKGQEPIRSFLWKQIERSGNTEIISIFLRYIPEADAPEYYEDIPWRALAPAFVLSELKTAFLIGFQVFLPFLIIDLVVSCVLVSSGMMMLPPAIVSLPFKLALFVLVDGWTLVVKSLLESFAWTIGV